VTTVRITDLPYEDRFVRALPGDPSRENRPRQVMRAAYTHVEPTAVPAPKLLALVPEVAALVGLDPQLAAGAGLRGADQRPVLAREGDRAAATGQSDLLGDLGDRADLEELVLMTRDEHDLRVLAHVDRQRDPHVREHDGVVEGDEPQTALGLRVIGGC